MYRETRTHTTGRQFFDLPVPNDEVLRQRAKCRELMEIRHAKELRESAMRHLRVVP